jgi:hypothetical protein
MKTVKILSLILAAAGLTVAVQSCKSVRDAKDNITSAVDFANAETEFSGAFDVTDDINQSDGKIKKGSGYILPSGAIFTWVDSVMDADGIKYDLDFGPLGSSVPYGLLCRDGKYRAGKLHIAVSKPYLSIGAAVTVTAGAGDEYHSGTGITMTKIEGVLSITRSAVETLDISISGGKVTFNGKTATFQGSKSITRTAGTGTPGAWGDDFSITGSGSGVNSEGDNYTWQITTPLLKRLQLGCARTFVKGVIEIKNTTASTSLSVDFDPLKNEACDLTARATIGNRTFDFEVR